MSGKSVESNKKKEIFLRRNEHEGSRSNSLSIRSSTYIYGSRSSAGIENELTAEDIKDAACVILSNDVAIRNEERFKGKKVVRMGTSDIMKKADGLLKKIQDTFQ